MGVLTVCNAAGGMARIVNSDAYRNDFMAAHPQGFDNHFSVLPGEDFDVAGAIRGSVASWRVGDFDYDASNPYSQSLASGGGLPLDQVKTLANLTVAPDTAGFFNIPVCETFDLRYFPPASNARCLDCGFGGTPGSTKRFQDAINDKVKKAIEPPPDCVQAYTMSVCDDKCPGGPYGPRKAQQNAAGYSPGWCGVHGALLLGLLFPLPSSASSSFASNPLHWSTCLSFRTHISHAEFHHQTVIQYQRNEGAGADPSQFRLTATIFDGEGININVAPNTPMGQNTLVEAPNGVPVNMTSRLPSPLTISVGPGDYDPVLFTYPGNAPWGSNDQPNHCNFGQYDSGFRQGDCGFSCA